MSNDFFGTRRQIAVKFGVWKQSSGCKLAREAYGGMGESHEKAEKGTTTAGTCGTT